MKKLYKNWFVHNVVGHPLSEIVYQVLKVLTNESIAEEYCGKIHDATIPEDYEEGRG